LKLFSNKLVKSLVEKVEYQKVDREAYNK
jgi:hypothetical protein